MTPSQQSLSKDAAARICQDLWDAEVILRDKNTCLMVELMKLQAEMKENQDAIERYSSIHLQLNHMYDLDGCGGVYV